MKTKRTLIVSSLIMCLTLIVAVVSITAAWFGDINSRDLAADLTIDSATIDSSANIEISSDSSSGNSVYPAVVNAKYYIQKSENQPKFPYEYPHGTVTGDIGEPQPNEEADWLYPPCSREYISQQAKVAVLYLTIEYIGVQDDNAWDGKKSLQMELEGVRLQSEMDALDEEHKYDAHNYRNEFNVKMSLVDKVGEGSVPLPSVTKEGNAYLDIPGKQVYWSNEYDEANKYGHKMQMRVAPGQYVVKFEIYFNKVDEECNFDLLNTQLNLHITIDRTINLVNDNGGEA